MSGMNLPQNSLGRTGLSVTKRLWRDGGARPTDLARPADRGRRG